MRLLDLFCGQGGCSRGYVDAGFTVWGVDDKPQPLYPYRFIQADWADVLELAKDFDVIHASPPCQAYSSLNGLGKQSHRVRVDLVPDVRMTLQRLGKHYVIENVPNSPLGNNAIQLCGSTFGLQVRRHRRFESNLHLFGAPCGRHDFRPVAVYGDHPVGNMNEYWRKRINRARSVEHAREAMGIDWMDWKGLTQAIPPAYTEYIGKQLLAQLG